MFEKIGNGFKWFYNMLGNTKAKKFLRFWLLIITIFCGIFLIFNFAYDKKNGPSVKPINTKINIGASDDSK